MVSRSGAIMQPPLIAAIVIAAAIGAAPLAGADEVPNMTNGVYEGQACGDPAGKFIFRARRWRCCFDLRGYGKPNVWVAAG